MNQSPMPVNPKTGRYSPGGVVALFITLTVCGCLGYSVKDEGVYYRTANEASGMRSTLIPAADPETFTTLEFEYGKDSKRVYYKGHEVPGADPASFRPLTRLYAVDAVRAYYSGDSIEGSNGPQFAIIDAYYSRDDKDVYYTNRALGVCSVKKFVIFPNKIAKNLSNRWATDGCHYFFGHYRIPSENYAATDIYFGSAGIAKDDKWVYFRDRIVNFDDNGDRIIDTVDVKTFQVTGYLDCRDRYGCINVYQGREKCE